MKTLFTIVLSVWFGVGGYAQKSKPKAPVALYDTLYSKDSKFKFLVDKNHRAKVDENGQVAIKYISDSKDKEVALMLDYLTPEKINAAVKANGSLTDAFIDTLDLARLPQFKGDSLYIYDCFIRFIKADVGFKKKIVFEESSINKGFFKGKFENLKILDSDFKDVVFTYASLSDFSFKRTILVQMEGLLTNENTETKKAMKVYSLTFYNCTFENAPVFGFTAFEMPKYIGCVFGEHVTFSSYAFDRNIYLQKIEILKQDQKSNRIESKDIDSNEFKEQKQNFEVSQSSVKNENKVNSLSFSNSIFNNGADFRGVFEDCSFTNTEFNKLIDLSEARINYSNKKANSFFRDAYFDDATVKLDLATIQSDYLNPLATNTPFLEERSKVLLADSLKIRPAFLKSLNFLLFFNSEKLHEKNMNKQNFNRIGLFFEKLKIYLATYQHELVDDDTKKEIINNLNFQFHQYERQHYWYQTFKEGKISCFVPWFLAAVRYYVVRNGYQGETRFFLIAIFIIVIFAWIFYQWYGQKVVAGQLGKSGNILESGTEMLKRMGEMKEDKNRWRFFEKKNMLGRHRLQNLGACFIQSFELFVFPKFPMHYLNDTNVKGSLLICFIVEWAIGIIMMAMFLYYIAGQYSFITKLLGI